MHNNNNNNITTIIINVTKIIILKIIITTIRMVVCSYPVTYTFQRKSTLHSCLNIKELLARSRCEIWSLSDCNWTWIHNHLVHKRTLNHLVKLASLDQFLSVRGFKSSCSHLNFRFHACFEQGVPCHWGNYRV